MSETFPSEPPPPPPKRGGGRVKPLEVEEVAALLPQYEVSALLGHGGMGAVYYGRQATLDRPVALKLLGAEVSADAIFASRFVREARAMARLTHPNIAAVYDFGQTGEGHLYFVMEYVDGANLHQLIKTGELDPARALSIFDQVCEAVEFAHGEGVIHRDIKPSNVLVDRRGRTKVADFGLARISSESDPTDGFVTQTGVVMGTPAYMAPEQKSGLNVDHRADIYSLGVLLYESLTGRIPQGVFAPPSRRVPNLDPRIDDVVGKALQEEPEDRFQSTGDMRAAMREARTVQASESMLAHAVEEAAPAAEAAPILPPRVVRRGRPKWLMPALVGLVILAVALAGSWYVSHGGKVPGAPVAPRRDSGWVNFVPKASSALEFAGGNSLRLHGKIPFGDLQAKDVAVRASIRLPEDSSNAQVAVRVGEGRRLIVEYRTRSLVLLRSESSAGAVSFESLSFLSTKDEWVELKFSVVGDQVYAAIDSRWVSGVVRESSPQKGGIEISGDDIGIKDISVMSLDGVPASKYPDWVPKAAAAPTPAAAAEPPSKPLNAPPHGGWIKTTPAVSSDLSGGADGIFQLHGRVRVGDYQAADAAIRATVRLKSDQGRMMLILRSVGGQEARCELRTNTGALETESPQEYVKYGNIAFPSKVNQWVEVQFAVVGDRLYGTVDGTPVPAFPLREARRQGGFALAGSDVELRDVSVMLLDDITGYPAWVSGAPATALAPAPTPAPTTAAPTPPLAPIPTPTPAPTPVSVQPQQEVTKWLAQVDADNQASFTQGVVQPYEAGLTALRANYRTNLDRQILLATQTRRAPDVKAWQREREVFNDGGQTVRESDYDSPPDAVRQLRAAFRAAAARLEQDRVAHAKAAFERYEKILQPNIDALTQRDRPEDAAFLRWRLEEVKSAWLAAAPQAAPAQSAPAQPASTTPRTIDLLPRIQVGRDTRSGIWRTTPEGLYLVSEPDHYAVCEIPYEPAAEYDFEVRFRALNDGLNVNMYLASQGHSFAWKMDAHGGSPPFYGFELYDGKTSFYNSAISTRVLTPIQSGKIYTSRVEVRRNSLRTYLDGVEFVSWTGDFGRFSMEPQTALRDPRHLGVGAFDRSVLFEKITLREYGGGAK